jgi:polysaccharide biosynthesis protein PslG
VDQRERLRSRRLLRTVRESLPALLLLEAVARSRPLLRVLGNAVRAQPTHQGSWLRQRPLLLKVALSTLALVHVTAVGAAPGPTAPPPTPPAPGAAYTSTDAGIGIAATADQLDRALGLVTSLFGEKSSPIVRIELQWWSVEPCRGCPLRWTELDQSVQAARERGMRVLLILDYAPPWANRHDSTIWFPTEDADWRSIVERTAAHFAGRIDAYEVWNEPNMVGLFSDYALADPIVRYWQLVRIAHEEIHRACPGCTVVAGGSAAGRPRGSWTNTPSEWLSYAYTHGYGHDFDAVALHPYTDWDGPSRSDCGSATPTMFGPTDVWKPCGELARLRTLMVANGDSATRIWATEFGYPVRPGTIDLDEARDNILLAISMWRMASYTGPLILYTLHDPCATATDAQCRYGLVDSAWQPKQPLFDTLATALGASNVLLPGATLSAERPALRSLDGRSALRVDGNGDLVLTHDDQRVWSTHGVAGATLVNSAATGPVLQDAHGARLWSPVANPSGTYQLVVQNDGNLVLYDSGQHAVWASGTAGLRPGQILRPGDTAIYSPDRAARLILQADGNLVLYGAGDTPLWSAGTSGAFRLVNQTDGNLVLYRRDQSVAWSTRTQAKEPATLVVRDDGTVVLIRDRDLTVVWSSATSK